MDSGLLHAFGLCSNSGSFQSNRTTFEDVVLQLSIGNRNPSTRNNCRCHPSVGADLRVRPGQTHGSAPTKGTRDGQDSHGRRRPPCPRDLKNDRQGRRSLPRGSSDGGMTVADMLPIFAAIGGSLKMDATALARVSLRCGAGFPACHYCISE